VIESGRSLLKKKRKEKKKTIIERIELSSMRYSSSSLKKWRPKFMV